MNTIVFALWGSLRININIIININISKPPIDHYTTDNC